MNSKQPPHGYSRQEWSLLCSLQRPERLQRFVDDEIAYNLEPDGPTCRSVRMVLRDRVAHCMEGALVAAAGLEALGYPPLLVDLTAVRDDDHVIAVYREAGGWGAVAKSNYSGLRFRSPVYRTIRELALSYFEDYFNLRGEKTLRGYSRPVRLSGFNGWRTSEDPVWEVPMHLVDQPHWQLFLPKMIERRHQADQRLLKAGRVDIAVKKGTKP